jgi:hypothetical protein
LQKPAHNLHDGFLVLSVLGMVTLVIFGMLTIPVSAESVSNNSGSSGLYAADAPYITVTYIEPINVRSGPSSFDYPIVGQLQVGETAPAIGRSPKSEWIVIAFPDGPRGVGWVYAANVTLTPPGILLPIVEPPPTPTPEMTPTLNQTFVAAFQQIATSTRMPTFTPPPPLEYPTYANPVRSASSRPVVMGILLFLGLFGVLGLIFSSIRHK